MPMSETGAQLVKCLDLKTPPDVLLNLAHNLFSIPLQKLREKLRFMFFAFSSVLCLESLQPCYIVPFVAPRLKTQTSTLTLKLMFKKKCKIYISLSIYSLPRS